MNDPLVDHLTVAFSRYFPDTVISVDNDLDNETITVTVRDTPCADPDFVFTMEIGSDDGWFSFTDTCGVHITVPLMAEQPSAAVISYLGRCPILSGKEG